MEDPATMHCEEGAERGTPCSVHLVRTENETPIVQFTRFGNYHRLLRTMAYALRFVHNCRATTTNVRDGLAATKMSGGLTAVEIDGAEKHVVRAVQKDAFEEELSALQRGESVRRSSPLAILLPFIADDGIMRVNGRIDRAEFLTLTSDFCLAFILWRSLWRPGTIAGCAINSRQL